LDNQSGLTDPQLFVCDDFQDPAASMIGKSFGSWDQLDELSWMNKPLMTPVLAGAAALFGVRA